MKQEAILQKINSALDTLYEKDGILFENDLCERCINHRFAVHLENQDFTEYHIDCEYNKLYKNGRTDIKRVSNKNGNYIDIVIGKRDESSTNDLLCFEIKKWNNHKNRTKDRKNLKKLTDQNHFTYKFGFYIIYGDNRKNVKIETYKDGKKIKIKN